MISAALTTYGLLFASPMAAASTGSLTFPGTGLQATYGTPYSLSYPDDSSATFSVGTSDGCSLTGTTLTVTDVTGSCDVTVTDSLAAEFGPYSIQLLPLDITVTADPDQTKVYGDPDPVSFAYTPSFSPLAGDSFDGALTREAGEDIGSYAITQGDLTLGDNYNITFVSDDFEITQRAITVNPVTDTKPYDGVVDSAVHPEVDPSTPLAFSDVIHCTEEFDAADPSAARELDVVLDSCTVMAGATDVTGNYLISYGVHADGVILPAAITVDPVTDSRAYDGTTDSSAEPVLAAGSSLASGDVLDCTQVFSSAAVGTRTLTVVPGSCVVMHDTTDVTGDYTFAYGTGVSGTITGRPITVNPVTDSKPYDGTVLSGEEPVLGSGTLVSGDALTCTQEFASAAVGTPDLVVDTCTVMNGPTDVTDQYAITFGAGVEGSITRAHLPLIGPGAIVEPGATSVTLHATVDLLCRADVTAEDITWTVVDLFGGTAPTLPAGTYVDGVATIVVPVVAGHLYGVTVSISATTNCAATSDPSGTISVPDLNAAAQGGGWYRIPVDQAPDERVNFGYTVNQKYSKATKITTYSGNLLWIINRGGDDIYRLKGTVTNYGIGSASDCLVLSNQFAKFAAVTGTGVLEHWDPEALEGLGDWESVGTTSFVVKLYDGGVSRVCTTNPKGKMTCKDTYKPDAFRMQTMDPIASEGLWPVLTTTDPFYLKGGNLTIK